MKTADPVNQPLVDLDERLGPCSLGLMSSQVWRDDPKRLLFSMARYKFVAKMLQGLESVAEVGCGDGFAASIVKQSVDSLLITDFDPLFIEKFRLNSASNLGSSISAEVHNILDGPLPGGTYDGIFSLDVIEHIPSDREPVFFANVCASLKTGGVAIIGAPSLESQPFASPMSKAGHINCKSGEDFRQMLKNYFNNVFLFSMNDEVVHTGFNKMAHYLIAICCAKK